MRLEKRLVCAAFRFGEFHHVQGCLRFLEPLSSERWVDTAILKEIDPLVKAVTGDIIKLVDFKNVIFREDFLDRGHLKHALLKLIQAEAVMAVYPMKFCAALIDIVLSLA